MRFPSASAVRQRPSRPPDGLPEPRPYGHLGPDDGACLMEAVSVLAAEPFTDSPRGTDPALAALARTVNDTVGSQARRRLLPLAADLAGARPAERSFTPSLIADVLGAALTVRPTSRSLALRAARCRRRARRLTGAAPTRPCTAAHASRLGDAVWWRGPGRHHLEHALRALRHAPDAEDRLVSLLHRAVASATAATGRTAEGAAVLEEPGAEPVRAGPRTVAAG